MKSDAETQRADAIAYKDLLAGRMRLNKWQAIASGTGLLASIINQALGHSPTWITVGCALIFGEAIGCYFGARTANGRTERPAEL